MSVPFGLGDDGMPVGAQAADVGRLGAGQQDGADRMGSFEASFTVSTGLNIVGKDDQEVTKAGKGKSHHKLRRL